MSKLVKITLNGKDVEALAGSTILDVCIEENVFVPRLCYLKDVHEEGNCRLCVVEVDGMKNLKPACRTEIYPNMKIVTRNARTHEHVVNLLELMASNHHFECFACPRDRNCEFLTLLKKYNVTNQYSSLHGYPAKEFIVSTDSNSIVFDSSKCVLCGRCVSACKKYTNLSIIDFNKRGTHTYVGPALFHPISDSGCIYCGKCLLSCPTGAIKEVDDIKLFDAALNDNAKKVIVQIAPAVRVALGEEFGMKIGTNVEGQIYAALKQIGVYDIAETTFGADLTIMEEGAELLDRLQNGGKLPLFTSCSPGWIRFIETYNHEYLANLSSCKSPMQMTGAIIKTYYVNKLKLSNSEIVSVAIMPCIAKKDEAARPEMLRNGRPDVDVVLTTREFARYLKSQGIDLAKLKPERATGELAQYTGAGIIFGATGGVMEASLRTVAHVLGDNLERIDYKEARGQKAIKEATINIGGYELNIAVVHGGTAIKHFMNKLKTTKKQYHFVEFMGCIGGCINGGGQPILTASEQEKVNIVQARTKAIYQADAKNNFRRSYENKEVKYLYDSGFLTHKKAHELLHTTYKAKNIYNNEE